MWLAQHTYLVGVSYALARCALSAQGSGDERDTTTIAQLRPHTPNRPDHLDVIYKKLPESDGTSARRGLLASPSKSLQLTGRFGELRTVLVRSIETSIRQILEWIEAAIDRRCVCAQGNTQVAELLLLQGQLSVAAAAVAHQVGPLNSPQAHGPTGDDSEFAEATADRWAEAASGLPSTGASAVHGLVASAASLLESGLGDELFLVSVDCPPNSHYAVAAAASHTHVGPN